MAERSRGDAEIASDRQTAFSVQAARLIVSIAPALALGVLFELFLGHRHDYAGHFLAGYGATLSLLAFVLRRFPSARSSTAIVALTFVCILLGVGTELTIFRIAKFDEIDFCNQSLGAVLAGIVMLAYASSSPPITAELDWAFIVGAAFLGAGGIYAVA